MRPNVLLVVLDAARRDALQPYGATGITPTIASLAARGLAMRDAYATSSWTLPSHASIFTGLMPRRLGLGQAPDGSPQSARPRLERVADRMLPCVLGQAGYATQGFSGNLWVSEHAGFSLGFDHFDYVPSTRPDRIPADADADPLRARLAWTREGLRGAGDDGAAELGRRLRSAIGRWSGTPTFWFVNLVECHSPYLPPRPWNDLPPLGRARAGSDVQQYQSFAAICRYVAGGLRIPARSIARMHHLYERSITYMDSWLAGVLAALSRRGILEHTLVIVTSDHGENFGEDGLIAHGYSLGQRLVHVPLVLAGPGTPAEDRLFSLAELPALIAQAAGLPDHPWRGDGLPAGVALAEYDGLAPPSDPRILEFAARFDLDGRGVAALTDSYTAATDGARKLLRREAAESLYDLRADPQERTPLPPDTDGFDPLRAALAAGTNGTAFGSEPTAAPGQGGASAEELAELEAQMKLLGYL